LKRTPATRKEIKDYLMDLNQSEHSNPAATDDETQPLPATEAAAGVDTEIPATDSLEDDAIHHTPIPSPSTSNPTTPIQPIKTPTQPSSNRGCLRTEGGA